MHSLDRRSVLHAAGLVAAVGFGGTVRGRGRPEAIDDCTVITEPGRYRVTRDLMPEYDEDQPSCIDIRADDVTLDGQGHVVDGPLDGTAIRATGVRDPTIRDIRPDGKLGIHLLDVTGARLRDLYFRSEDGIILERTTESRITHSHLPTDFSALSLSDSSDNEVSKCIFDMETGVGLSGSSRNTIRHNRFSGNIVSISLFGSSDNSVVDNQVFDCVGRPVYLHEADDNVLRRNEVVPGPRRYGDDSKSSSIYPGISLSSSSGNSLQQNTVTHSDEEGILLVDSDDNHLARNTVCHNDDGDIVLVDSHRNVLERNTTDC